MVPRLTKRSLDDDPSLRMSPLSDDFGSGLPRKNPRAPFQLLDPLSADVAELGAQVGTLSGPVWVNVKDPAYGATGNGTTDDTAAIQAALNAATGPVVFPRGTYKLTAKLTVPSDNLLLVGDRATISCPANGDQAVYGTGRAGVTVRGLTFAGSSGNLGGKGQVYFVNSTNIAIEENVFSAAVNGGAVLLEGCKYSEVRRNKITGTDYGILVGSLSTNGSTTADYNVIDANYVDTSGHDGIFVTASLGSSATTNTGTGNRITNNTVLNSSDAGIESGIGQRGSVIANNTVKGSAGPNILLRDNTDATVVGNYAAGNTALITSYGGGIAVLDQTAASFRIQIVGNTSLNNAGPGITVIPGSSPLGKNFVVAGNMCSGNGGPAGINLVNAPGSAINGNLCLANTNAGILVDPVPSTNQGSVAVTGNTCGNNGTYGIRIRADNVQVCGNRCYDDQTVKTQTYGVSLEGTQANFVSVMGNNLNGNATDAIHDDGAGTGNRKFNNMGVSGTQAYDIGAFDLQVSANLNVGGKLKMADGVLFGVPGGGTQFASACYAGTGVPNNSNGSNGDFYFRSDGTAAGNSVVYHKEGGSWVALVTT